eukprot:1596822-Pleurochrysis_carterae.AAC.1
MLESIMVNSRETTGGLTTRYRHTTTLDKVVFFSRLTLRPPVSLGLFTRYAPQNMILCREGASSTSSPPKRGTAHHTLLDGGVV